MNAKGERLTVPDCEGFCPGPRVRMGGAPEGPLQGLSFAVKDVFDIKGEITGAGNPDWASTHGPATLTASLVQQALDLGATLIGKTLTEELAYSLIGENIHYGAPRNPAAPGHVAGGSSSGSASVVAEGLVDFALGTDTAGSVRIPASNCGLYGFRPSHGALPADGIVPLAPSFDVPGWFARDATVFRRVGQALLKGADGALFTSLRLQTWACDLLPPDCRTVLLEAAGGLAERTGLPMLKQASPSVDPERMIGVFRTIQGREAWAAHGVWIKTSRPNFASDIAARFRWASGVTREEAEAAARERLEITTILNRSFADGSLLVLPTAPCVPLKRNSSESEKEDYRRRTLLLTSMAGLAGLPQVSLPLASIGGLPLGLSLLAGRNLDAALLGFIEGV